jgi:glucose-1-phosphate thymidylyltransferase
MLLNDKANVKVQRVEGWWKDSGNFADLLEANRLVLDDLKPQALGVVEDDSSIRGRVSLESGSIVRKGANIMGPSILGKNSRLEEGVYVGPYTSIGNNVTVRRGEIENSIVMDGCTIDTDERITESLIGPNSAIVSRNDGRPRGKKLIIGERSIVEF